MIESTVRDYLAEKLTVDVYLEQPKEKPETFVLIEKTGGRLTEHIRSATMTIQSYATSLYNAAKLNEEIIKAMEDILELNEITSCTLNSDYNYTDTRTKQYRYQAVFNLIYY
jgi:hypothetical protein